jgi:hypothetical protein
MNIYKFMKSVETVEIEILKYLLKLLYDYITIIRIRYSKNKNEINSFRFIPNSEHIYFYQLSGTDFGTR